MSELKVSLVRLEKDTVKNKHIWYVHYYNSTEVTIFEEGDVVLVKFAIHEKPQVAVVFYSHAFSIHSIKGKEISFRLLNFDYRVPHDCHSLFVSKVKLLNPVIAEDSLSYKKLYE